MNAKTVEKLCQINKDFYQGHAASFSETRQSPWSGWGICLETIKDDCLRNAGFEKACRAQAGVEDAVDNTPLHFSVFDLACGNLRFKAFLDSSLPRAEISYYAVDNCDDLVPTTVSVSYQNLDIMEILQKGLSFCDLSLAPQSDLSVCFGFMHHVPSQDYRKKVLASLIDQTRLGGYVLVSFWQFLNNKTMGERALAIHDKASRELGLKALDKNDFLLGWKNKPGVYRYCHSFSDTEIDQLAESVSEKTTVLSRFVADGRSENLNTYLVLRKR